MTEERELPPSAFYARVGALAAYFFLVMLGIILGRGARDSLFLSHPQLGVGALPWIYIGNALFGAGMAAGYAALSARSAPRRFAFLSLGLFAACVVGARFLAGRGVPGVVGAAAVVAAYLLAQAVWVLGLMQVWTLAAVVFEPREAKRAYPLVGAGSLVGMILAGFIAKPIVRAFGTLGVFWVWAGLILAATAVLAAVIAPRLPSARPGKGAGANGRPGLAENWRLVRETPLLRVLLVLTLLLWTVFTILDYQFNLVAKEAYTLAAAPGAAPVVDRDGLTAFLGVFRGVCGFGALLFQFLVTPFLVARLGVGRATVAHPLSNTVTTGIMWTVFGFWTTTVAKGVDHVLLYTIQDSSYSLLFNALPVAVRDRARGFVDGTVRPVATGLGGVVLVLGTYFLSPAELSGLLFLLSAGWLVAALRVREAYVEGLVSALAPERRGGEEGRAARTPESVAAIRAVIARGDPAKAATAMDMAVLLGATEILPEIRASLASASPELRGTAASALGVLGEKEDFERLVSFAHEGDPEIRAKAIEACGALGSEMSVEELVPFVKDPSETVRVAAIIALIRIGGLDGILAAAETIARMLEAAAPGERAVAAKILGEVRVRHFVPSLLKLLKDADPLVRHRAARSLGKIGSDRAAGPLVECLADPHLRQTALYGLTRLGPKAVPALRGAMASPVVEIRRLAAKALSLIRTEGVEEILLPVSGDEDLIVRSFALDGLASLLVRPVAAPERRAALMETVRDETKYAYRNRLGARLIETHLSNGGSAAVAFLVEIAREEERASARRALLALGLVTRPDAILGLAELAVSRLPRERALALEAIENLGEIDLSRPLLALYDPEENGEWEKNLPLIVKESQRNLEGFLERFSTHPSPIVRASLAHALAASGGSFLPKILEGLRRDPDTLVAESAHGAASAAKAQSPGGERMLTNIEKVLFLRSAPLFGSIRREDLPHIAAISEPVEVAAGSVLFEAGGAGDALYLIVSGTTEILDTKGRLVAELAPPEVVGEMAILDDGPRTATARAKEDSTLLRISREEFRELIMDRPEIAFAIFKVLVTRVRTLVVAREPGRVLAV